MYYNKTCYNTIEELLCDDSIPAKVRVHALNNYEETYNACFVLSNVINSWGRAYRKDIEKAKIEGLNRAFRTVNDMY